MPINPKTTSQPRVDFRHLTVVLPFCAKDRDRANDLVKWINTLGGCLKNDLIVVHSNDTRDDLVRMIWKSVTTIQPPFALPDESHPIGPNWLFETTLMHFYRSGGTQPFLWLEPDCVPTRKGWLEEIETEYRAALRQGKRILARVTTLNDPKFPARIPSGVAVYPGDAWKIYNRLQLNRKVAWDVQFANDAMPHVFPSATIFSRMNRKRPPTFVKAKKPTDPENALTLEMIPTATALFHPSKDGTLIEILRERIKPEPPPAAPPKKVEPALVPIDNLQQPAPYDCPSPERWSLDDFMGTVPLITAPKQGVPASTRKGRIIHCVQRWKPNNKNIDQRIHVAVRSWIALYMTGDVVPCHIWKFERDARGIGDARNLPYMRDILEAGLRMSTSDSDIIMLTNDDSVLHPELPQKLFDKIQKFVTCVCAGRLNYKEGESPTFLPESKMPTESDDIGRDAFAFRASWLRKNFSGLPDMFLGEAQFDIVLASMIRRFNNIPPTLESRPRCVDKCELRFGYVQHQMHERGWMMGPTPAQKHNLREAVRWYEQNNMKHMIDFAYE